LLYDITYYNTNFKLKLYQHYNLQNNNVKFIPIENSNYDVNVIKDSLVLEYDLKKINNSNVIKKELYDDLKKYTKCNNYKEFSKLLEQNSHTFNDFIKTSKFNKWSLNEDYKINTDEYMEFILSHNFNKNFHLIKNFNKEIFNRIITNYKSYKLNNFSNYEDFRYIKKLYLIYNIMMLLFKHNNLHKLYLDIQSHNLKCQLTKNKPSTFYMKMDYQQIKDNMNDNYDKLVNICKYILDYKKKNKKFSIKDDKIYINKKELDFNDNKQMKIILEELNILLNKVYINVSNNDLTKANINRYYEKNKDYNNLYIEINNGYFTSLYKFDNTNENDNDDYVNQQYKQKDRIIPIELLQFLNQSKDNRDYILNNYDKDVDNVERNNTNKIKFNNKKLKEVLKNMDIYNDELINKLKKVKISIKDGIIFCNMKEKEINIKIDKLKSIKKEKVDDYNIVMNELIKMMNKNIIKNDYSYLDFNREEEKIAVDKFFHFVKCDDIKNIININSYTKYLKNCSVCYMIDENEDL